MRLLSLVLLTLAIIAVPRPVPDDATQVSLVPEAPHVADPAAAVDDRGGASPLPVAPAKWTATYCKPTGRYCKGWGGDAHLAAVRSFTWGDEPYWIRVSRVHGGQVSTTTVLVVSYCDCGSHNIDLSFAAYLELDPTANGRISVLAPERIDGVPTRTAPPTDVDTEGG